MTQSGLITSGWIFLIIAWGSILFFTFYCFKKVLFSKSKKEQSE